MVLLLALTGCGGLPDPLWLLTDEPRVLAFRVEVVEPGPHSNDLLPIPADRVRDEGLPGDVVEVSTWIVSAEHEYDTAEVDPIWFLCPQSGGCVSTFSQPGSAEPCQGEVPEKTACRLGEGPTVQFEVPPLQSEVSLLEQARPLLAMVGHVDDDLSTEDCVGIVGDPRGLAWDGCIVGYHRMPMGPLTRLYELAIDEGVEVPDPSAPALFPSSPVPHFNPEVTSLRLVPGFSDGTFDGSRVVEAWPGEVVVLEPGYVYGFLDFSDARDIQQYFSLDGYGVRNDMFAPTVSLTTGTPDLFEPGTFQGTLRIRAPEEPGMFSVHLALVSITGSAAWATFDFEVRDP